MNPYLSQKLKIISFILIVMVVFLHAHNLSGKGDLLNYYVQNLISNGITKMSVALFFVISGYLFFFNLHQADNSDFQKKISSRFRTIFIPYLLWSLWGILFFFLLQAIPFSRSFFNSDLLQEKSLPELLHILFVKPLPYQLWFLRHLFLFALLSPLIYVLTRYFKGIVGLLLIAILLLKIVEIPDNDFIHNRSLAYFCLGAYLGVHGQHLVLRRYAKWGIVATVLWLTLVVWRIVGDSQGLMNDKLWRNFIQHSEYLIGIFALWSLYDFFIASKKEQSKVLPTFLVFAFFLYASHEPILTIAKKMGLKILGNGIGSQLAVYFAAPIFTILLCISMGMLLKNVMPSIYAKLSGGR
ncbi:MAG: acyltransferase [Bacteroidota bacterium]